MNTVRQEVSAKMASYRNGGAINIEKEIGLILMRPTNPAVVTTQSLGIISWFGGEGGSEHTGLEMNPG